MLKSRLLTPFNNQSHKPPNKASELPQPQPPFIIRHSTTPSGISLGKKIQLHLDAGKPLYIGFDPADPQNEEEGNQERQLKSIKRVDKFRKWLRVLTFGAPLDIAVKFIFPVGLSISFMALLWAMNWLIQNRRLNIDFNIVIVIGQCSWGLFFGASCIFGMELMWGKWRRSPSAALFFTICWVLVTLVLLVSSGIWIYFYFLFRKSYTEKCKEKTVKVTITWDKDPLRRMAPQSQIKNCLDNVDTKTYWILGWGVTYAIFTYFGIIVVIWGRDYRRRLLTVRKPEESSKLPNNRGEDQVGLLLGTAPLESLSNSKAIGPRNSILERDRAGSEEEDIRPLPARRTKERRSDTEIIRTIASRGTIPPIPRRDRIGSVSSNVTNVGGTRLGVSVEGQRFVDATR